MVTWALWTRARPWDSLIFKLQPKVTFWHLKQELSRVTNRAKEKQNQNGAPQQLTPLKSTHLWGPVGVLLGVQWIRLTFPVFKSK